MLIYLAVPYSSPCGAVKELRYHAVTRAAAQLVQLGYLVFSPISMSHPMVTHGCRPDFDYWRRFDEKMILACDEVWVLKLDGWHKSVGVTAEIEIANQLGKKVRYIDTDWIATEVAVQAHFRAQRRSSD